MAVWSLISPRTRDILLCGLLGFCLPAYAAFVKGFPDPSVHDEFSYLLAADTFAEGRLTNPAPPLPEFFEAPHILVEPSYQSKYMPGTGLVLAAGQALFGHPRWGLWFLCGSFAAAVCWMLQAFTSRRWALTIALGALFSVVPRFGGGYSSTMLAGASAAAIFGSLPRIFRRPNLSATTMLALGVMGSALSRPFEGLMVCLGAAPAFLAWLVADRRSRLGTRITSVVLPAFLAVAAGGIWLGCYNQAVTGRWCTLPYSVHHQQYFHHGLFAFSTSGTPRLPKDPGRVADIYRGFQINRESKVNRTRPWPVEAALQGLARARGAVNAAFGHFETSQLGLIWIVPVLLAGLRGRAAAFAPSFLMVCLGHALTTWYDTSYSIVILPWFFTVLAENSRRLVRGMHIGRSNWLHPGIILLIGIILVAGPEAGAFFNRLRARISGGRLVDISLQETGIASRGELWRFLSRQAGKHLVFVGYHKGYNIHDEWVFNGADLIRAPILFAHDLGEERNRALMVQYAERQCWRMEVGIERNHLSRLNKSD
jgi:hypothetical protein